MSAVDFGDFEKSLFSFQPNADTARFVDARVRSRLADSLTATLQALAGNSSPLGEDLVARVRASSVATVIFGAYTGLVEAIFFDDIETASKIANELCAADFGRVGDLRIVTLHDSDLGEGQAARYRRLL